jgi:hypothetical protein
MGSYPSTLTPCPFPFTTPPNNNTPNNNNTTNITTVTTTTTEQQCTITYAQRVGTSFAILQWTCVICSGMTCIILLFRLKRLTKNIQHKFTNASSMSEIKFTHRELFIMIGIPFSFSMFLSNVDCRGYNNFLPPQVFSFMDDITVSSALNLGIVMEHFLITISVLNTKSFFQPQHLLLARNSAMIILYCNMIGFSIIEFCDTSRFLIYSLTKYIIAGIIVAIIMIMLLISTFNLIRVILRQMAFVKANNVEDTFWKKTGRILTAKFIILYVAWAGALFGCVTLADGCVSQMQTYHTSNWISVPIDTLPVNLIIIKAAEMVGCIILLTFFGLPHSNNHVSSSGPPTSIHSGGNVHNKNQNNKIASMKIQNTSYKMNQDGSNLSMSSNTNSNIVSVPLDSKTEGE